MITIGLVGEDPYDTSSIATLLQQKYGTKVRFRSLLKNISGWQLDSAKAKRSITFEFQQSKCRFVLYIRDLDGFKTNSEKIAQKQQWFSDLDAKANNKGLLLLNIWELEALILSDIQTFNRLYKTKIKFIGDPMTKKEPKEFLKQQTSKGARKYHESDCPEIFEKLNFTTVQKNCRYFKDFTTAFDKKVK